MGDRVNPHSSTSGHVQWSVRACLDIQCFRHNPTHVVASVGKVNMLSLTKSCSGFDKVQCNIDIRQHGSAVYVGMVVVVCIP